MIRHGILVLALLAAPAASLAAQPAPLPLVQRLEAEAEEPSPQFLPAERTSAYNGPNRTPNLQPLSAEEREQVAAFIRGLPPFPQYLFSGCHDRAHAAFLLLPEALKSRAAKIWVFAPARYTATVSGVLQIRNPTGELDSRVEWGYHVALAFLDGDSLLVFDAALAPDRLLRRDEWFGMMVVPSFTFWTLFHGSTYLFNATENARFSPNGQMFNGTTFGYGGTSAEQQWIPKALARDAVGEAIVERNACEALRPLVTQPGLLLDSLTANRIPDECPLVREIYEQELAVWSQRLR